MPTCQYCGGAIEFRYVNGVCTPIHLSGSCFGGGSGRYYAPAKSQARQDPFYRYESFVNPHATCPVCGAEVFYYEAPNGGRVYFDALGPPWPKHPCTDNSGSAATGLGTSPAGGVPGGNAPIVPNRPSGGGLPLRNYPWKRQGWAPLLATQVEPIHNGYFLEIRGLLDRQETTLFVRHKQGIEKRSPMLLRRTKDSHVFEFSTVVARRFNSVLVILEMKLKAYSQLHLATAVFRPSKKDGMIDADFKPSDIIARIPLNERFPEQPSAADRSPNTGRSRRATSQPNHSTTMAQAFKSARAERKK
jgi:hypothetical protein